MASEKEKMKPVKIGIVVNLQKPGAAALVGELNQYAQVHRDIEFFWEKRTASLLKIPGYELPDLVKKVELFLVAGGDGSLLETARKLFPAQIPILGVNIGSLGFLTSLAQTELMEAMPLLAQRRWLPSPRLAFETTIYRKKTKSIVPCSLNDVVVSRGLSSRLVRIYVQIGDAFVTEYVCDGLIVSTPTGSTAYAVSAGGPMVSPDTEAFMLTPICAHTLTNRSLVVSTEKPIRIQIPAQQRTALKIYFDGQSSGSLQPGDRLEISRAKASVLLAYTSGRDFYTILRQKLKWSGASV